MKRLTYVFLVGFFLLACLASGCSQNSVSNNSGQIAKTLAEAEPIFVSEWPENEYTARVIKPPYGETDHVYDLSDSGKFAVFLKNISKSESAEYVEQLKKDGYQEVFSQTNESSAGVMLEKEAVLLNVSYSDEIFSMMITVTT